jgi:hypothetical protein
MAPDIPLREDSPFVPGCWQPHQRLYQRTAPATKKNGPSIDDALASVLCPF